MRFRKTVAVLLLPPTEIPVGPPAPKLVVSPLIVFRLALAVTVPPLKLTDPIAIPTGLPMADVLRPLIVFEVTVRLMVVPMLGPACVVWIPVTEPLALLMVLIVFEVRDPV